MPAGAGQLFPQVRAFIGHARHIEKPQQGIPAGGGLLRPFLRAGKRQLHVALPPGQVHLADGHVLRLKDLPPPVRKREDAALRRLLRREGQFKPSLCGDGVGLRQDAPGGVLQDPV